MATCCLLLLLGWALKVSSGLFTADAAAAAATPLAAAAAALLVSLRCFAGRPPKMWP
jgi:hypothetical protein